MPNDLEKLFVERLNEEMGERQLSANQLAKDAKKKGYALGQRSVSRILKFEQSPTLETVHEIADTMGLPAWAFLTRGAEQRVITPPHIKSSPQKIVELPPRYPKIFGNRSQSKNGGQRHKRAPGRK